MSHRRVRWHQAAYEVLQRDPVDRRHVHRSPARRDPQRERVPRHHRRRHVRGVPPPGRHRLPGRCAATRPLQHDERVLEWVRTATPVDHVHHIRRCTGSDRARRGRLCSMASPPPPTAVVRTIPEALVWRPRVAATSSVRPIRRRANWLLDWRRIITSRRREQRPIDSGAAHCVEMATGSVDRTRLALRHDPVLIRSEY